MKLARRREIIRFLVSPLQTFVNPNEYARNGTKEPFIDLVTPDFSRFMVYLQVE
jgi:hypothetical protein